MTLNGWTEFVNDCKLCSKHSKCCRRSDFDLTFAEIDAASKKEAEAGDCFRLLLIASRLKVA